MRKINDLFHKRVIDQNTGNAVATVRDVVLSDDARRVVALVVGGERAGDEQIIRWDSVMSVGEYVVVDGSKPWAAAHEDTEVNDLRQQAERITGKQVMSSSGEHLGTVSDMFYNMRGELIGYELKRGLFGGSSDSPILPAEHVRAIGKDAIIADSSDFMTINDLDLDMDEPHERHTDDPYATKIIPDAQRTSMPAQPDEPTRDEPFATTDLAGAPPPMSVQPDAPLREAPPPLRERELGEPPVRDIPFDPEEPPTDQRRDLR